MKAIRQHKEEVKIYEIFDHIVDDNDNFVADKYYYVLEQYNTTSSTWIVRAEAETLAELIKKVY